MALNGVTKRRPAPPSVGAGLSVGTDASVTSVVAPESLGVAGVLLHPNANAITNGTNTCVDERTLVRVMMRDHSW